MGWFTNEDEIVVYETGPLAETKLVRLQQLMMFHLLDVFDSKFYIYNNHHDVPQGLCYLIPRC